MNTFLTGYTTCHPTVLLLSYLDVQTSVDHEGSRYPYALRNIGTDL